MLRTSTVTFAPRALNFIYSHKINLKVRTTTDYFRIQREDPFIDTHTHTHIESTRDMLLDFYNLHPNAQSLQSENERNTYLNEVGLLVFQARLRPTKRFFHGTCPGFFIFSILSLRYFSKSCPQSL